MRNKGVSCAPGGIALIILCDKDGLQGEIKNGVFIALRFRFRLWEYSV